MEQEEYDHLFKILLIGDTAVGKTSVLLRYVDDIFNTDFKTTIGVDFKISTIELDNKKIKLQMWDTAGQDKFRNIVASYYRGAHGIIIFYDVTNQESLQSTQRWEEETKTYLTEDVPKLLVGNKIDLEEQRVVSTEQGQEMANRLGMQYLETSARNNQNIREAFQAMSRAILTKWSTINQRTRGQGHTTTVMGGKPVKKGCCS